MRVTNRFGLPRTLVNLAERDDYTRGHARVSVTQLIGPPRIDILKRRYHDEIERDVSDSIWMLVGRALHAIAEAGADEQHLAEERCYAEVNGWVVSGGIDLQMLGENSVKILDYKFTNSYAVREGKIEWEAQLNCYSWLVAQSKGWTTEALEVCALIRDWSRRRMERDPNYPRAPVQVVQINLWTPAEQLNYIRDRVRLHQEAWRASQWGDELPLCTPEEKWLRKGEPIRCLNYCPVSAWCTDHRRWKESNGG